MNTKARITYRFDKENGALEKRSPQQEKVSQSPDVVPFVREEMSFTKPTAKWNSPFQDDAYALEQLIRQTDTDSYSPPRRQQPVQEEIVPVGTSKPEWEVPLGIEEHAELEPYMKPPALVPLEDDVSPIDEIPLGDEPRGNLSKTDVYQTQAANLLESETNGPMIDPILLEQEMRRSSKASFLTSTPTTYRSHRGPSWMKVFASVAGAVATGALFGYLVLALFTGGGNAANTEGTSVPASGNSAPVASSDSTNTASAGNQTADDGTSQTPVQQENKPAANQPDPAGSRIAVDVPGATYSMLQYGVFSSKAGMEAAVAELQTKGLAASSYSTGSDYRVYVGMSTDRDAAATLKGILPGMELYVKQVEIPAVTGMSYTGKPEEVQTFFAQTNELLGQLDRYSSNALEQAEVNAASWQEAYQAWTASSKVLEKSLTDTNAKGALQNLTASLKAAAASGSAYAKEPSDAQLWAIQSSIMDAVFTLKSWSEANLSL